MRTRTGIALLISAAVVSWAHSVKAEVLFYFGGSTTNQGGMVAGNSFNAFSNQTLNSLGFIDVGSDGLAASYQVGLWDTASQTLLASTTVTPSSPLINGFRYAPIPATTIPGGTSFTIGALLPPTPTPDAWVTNTTLVLGVGFTGAGIGRFTTGNSLDFPATLDTAPYAVANASDVVIPEPASFSAIGLLLIGRRRKR